MFDFGIGGSEILLVAVVALVVIGPKDLPKVLRVIGKALAGVRGMASEFQVHINAAMRDTGLDEVTREVGNLKSMASAEIAKQSDNFLKAQREVAELMEKERAEAQAEPSPAPAILPPPAPEPVSPGAKKTPKKKAVAKKAVKKAVKKKAAKKARRG